MIIILILAAVIGFIILCFIILGLICNKRLVSTEYEIKCESLPKEFDGLRILHISDLHNCAYSKGNRRLIKLAKDSAPNLIAITGDMIDSRKPKAEVALNLAKELVKIAPCYYVTGNHEARLKETAEKFIQNLTKTGVTYLDNKAETIIKDGGQIKLMGIKDPFHYWSADGFNRAEIVGNNLSKVTCENENNFRILLTHRPETFGVYEKFGIDLSLAGHAHGGQIRLPFAGGLFAPCQGFFPKLDCGHHQRGKSHLVISRGLGNSSFPVRIFNPPEVALVKLTSKTK